MDLKALSGRGVSPPLEGLIEQALGDAMVWVPFLVEFTDIVPQAGISSMKQFGRGSCG